MTELAAEFLENVDESVRENRGILVITYELNEETEAKIDAILERILTKFDRPDLKAAAYTCIKELVINASKANFKWIYFEEHAYHLEDHEEYLNKSAEFKQYLQKEGVKKLAGRARELNKDVRLMFQYNEIGLRVKIMNDTPITPEDDLRIRDRLRVGSQYDDIAQFYMDHADSLEGEGIGIALIQILLRGENIDHKGFTIWTDDKGLTTAKLDFPFTGESFPGARK